MKAQRGVEVYLYSFFNFGARWWWVVNTTPRPLYPQERDPVPIDRRLGGRQGRSGRVWNPPPPKFDPRTVQPVQSLCTASANPTDP